MQFLAQVRLRYSHLAFLMITGVDDIQLGVEAMKKGADDYLVKPLQLEVVMASLERDLEKRRFQQEVENYRRHLEDMEGERTKQLESSLLNFERTSHGLCTAPYVVNDYS